MHFFFDLGAEQRIVEGFGGSLSPALEHSGLDKKMLFETYRCNNLAGLSDLQVVGDEAGVDGGSGRAHGGVQLVS